MVGMKGADIAKMPAKEKAPRSAYCRGRGQHLFRPGGTDVAEDTREPFANVQWGRKRAYRPASCDISTRKALARRYGLTGPNQETMVPCAYCGVLGRVWWIPSRGRRQSGRLKPSWVYFDHHIEHVVPCIEGGTSDLSNLVLACPSCNYTKGTKMPQDFRPEVG